ncbi:chromatin modification- protein VID21, partial [Coemansia sp. RSA 486]
HDDQQQSAGISSRVLLDRERQQLLKEYFLWAHASSSDISKALEHSDPSRSDVISEIVGTKAQLESFVDSYYKSPDRALQALKESSEKFWGSLAVQDSICSRQSSAASKTVQSTESDMEVDGVSDGGENDSQEDPCSSSTTEDEANDVVGDFSRFMHPEDVVFLSQLDPIGIAEVTDSYTAINAEMLGNSMSHYNYQESIEDINSKSINMHNWLLHMQEQPLYEIIRDSSKLVSTKDWDCVREELIHMRVMERIEELKEKGKWSFWQPQKHRAPPRGKAHWDYVLDEVVWMQADFCEERKLRVALAKMVSSWVMDYHHAVNKRLYTVNGRKRVLPDEFLNREQKGEPVDACAQTPLLTDLANTRMEVSEGHGALQINNDDVESPRSQSRNPQDMSVDSNDSGTQDSSQMLLHSTDMLTDTDRETNNADDASAALSVVPLAVDDGSAQSQQAESGLDALAASSSEPAKQQLPLGVSDEKPSEETAVPTGASTEPVITNYSEATTGHVLPTNAGLLLATEGNPDSKSEPVDATATIPKPEKLGAVETPEDHVVPTSNGSTESALSVYHILAQLPQTDQMEVILGDSIYTLQSLSSLMPYGPAWDDAYCD